MKKGIIVALATALTAFLGMIAYVSLQEVEGRSALDPSGRYRAVVSFRNYQTWLGRPPGDSSGKPGYITIYDQDGKSYGKVPVTMISELSNLRWNKNGAWIPAYCEWNFDTRTYRYWNDDQTRETVKKAE